MHLNSKIPNDRTLMRIWAQVPVDYYDTLNIGQRLWHNHKWNLFRKLLLTYIPKPKSVLEVGCSGGHLTVQLSVLYPKAKITGVDVYKSAITVAQKRYPDITFRVADAHALPFGNNSFDLVLCSETIEHVINPAKVLHEIHRVLSKNGIAVVEMDSGNLMFRIVWWIWTNLGKGKVWQDAHLHPFTASELESKIISNGFTVKNRKISHLGMAVTFVVYKKNNKSNV